LAIEALGIDSENFFSKLREYQQKSINTFDEMNCLSLPKQTVEIIK